MLPGPHPPNKTLGRVHYGALPAAGPPEGRRRPPRGWREPPAHPGQAGIELGQVRAEVIPAQRPSPGSTAPGVRPAGEHRWRGRRTARCRRPRGRSHETRAPRGYPGHPAGRGRRRSQKRTCPPTAEHRAARVGPVESGRAAPTRPRRRESCGGDTRQKDSRARRVPNPLGNAYLLPSDAIRRIMMWFPKNRSILCKVRTGSRRTPLCYAEYELQLTSCVGQQSRLYHSYWSHSNEMGKLFNFHSKAHINTARSTVDKEGSWGLCTSISWAD